MSISIYFIKYKPFLWLFDVFRFHAERGAFRALLIDFYGKLMVRTTTNELDFASGFQKYIIHGVLKN